jgi:hypothetical protein
VHGLWIHRAASKNAAQNQGAYRGKLHISQRLCSNIQNHMYLENLEKDTPATFDWLTIVHYMENVFVTCYLAKSIMLFLLISGQNLHGSACTISDRLLYALCASASTVVV